MKIQHQKARRKKNKNKKEKNRIPNWYPIFEHIPSVPKKEVYS